MLKHSIAIEQKSVTKDTTGGSVVTWSTLFNTYASIQHKTGMERNQAGKLEAVKKTEMVLRYDSRVTAEERINFNGRLFQIRAAINVDENSNWLLLLCEEGVVT